MEDLKRHYKGLIKAGSRVHGLESMLEKELTDPKIALLSIDAIDTGYCSVAVSLWRERRGRHYLRADYREWVEINYGPWKSLEFEMPNPGRKGRDEIKLRRPNSSPYEEPESDGFGFSWYRDDELVTERWITL